MNLVDKELKDFLLGLFLGAALATTVAAAAWVGRPKSEPKDRGVVVPTLAAPSSHRA